MSSFLKFASRKAVNNNERVGWKSGVFMRSPILNLIAALLDKRQLIVGLAGMLMVGTVAAEPRAGEMRVLNEKRQIIRLSQLRKDRCVMVLVFVSSTCPATQFYWERIKGTWHSFRDKNVLLVLVGGNSDDTMENIRKILEERDLGELTVVWDEKHALARQLGVEFTPVAVVLGRDGEVLYRGRFDDSWRDESRITQRYLTDAIGRALEGKKCPDQLDAGFMGSRLR